MSPGGGRWQGLEDLESADLSLVNYSTILHKAVNRPGPEVTQQLVGCLQGKPQAHSQHMVSESYTLKLRKTEATDSVSPMKGLHPK